MFLLDQIPLCDSHGSAFWIFFVYLTSDPNICSRLVFPQSSNSDQVAVSVSTDVHSISKRVLLFIAQLLIILMLTGMIFVRNIYLNCMLLLLLPYFMTGSRLELMNMSFFKNNRSGKINFHGFQLLVLLSCHISYKSFVPI